MKGILLLLIICNMLVAQVEIVSIGKIDKRYNDLVSRDDLVEIIKNIEVLFEKQLGFNVFDYKKIGGKPIDIIYMPPSQKKKRILKNQKKLESLKEKIANQEVIISHKKIFTKSAKKELERQYKNFNRDVEELNRYISRKNSSRNLSKYDYESIKRHISKEQSEIKMKRRDLDRKKRQFNFKVLSLKNKIHKFNSLISKYNYYQRDIEKLSKSHKEIKGKIKKRIQTTYTTYIKNGKSTSTQDKKIDSEKIEIYDFENLNLLKVILAHELAHLVGVGHIDAIGSLMHPHLQKKQIINLSLTPEDIKAFRECFKSSK